MAIVLVVEDDIFIRQTLGWVLEDMGHNALAARDLAEALAHLVTAQPIDALFVDIRLNALAFGGYDVADKAIGFRPHLPVLYTSGRPLSNEMTERFVPGGCFLRKPYSSKQIEIFITQALH